MEKIQIRCEYCSALLAVPQTAAGKKIRCPKCQGIVFVTIDNVRPVPQRNQESPAADDTKRQSRGEDSRSSDRKNQRQHANSTEKPNKVNTSTFHTSQIPPDASRGWYCQIMGDILGPMDASELLQQFEKGRLDSDTLVRREADESWGELREFISVLRAPQPPSIRTPPIPSNTLSPKNEPSKSFIQGLQNEIAGFCSKYITAPRSHAAATSANGTQKWFAIIVGGIIVSCLLFATANRLINPYSDIKRKAVVAAKRQLKNPSTFKLDEVSILESTENKDKLWVTVKGTAQNDYGATKDTSTTLIWSHVNGDFTGTMF